eukprot:CAMPEP_0185695210 /NCGR_PEP_ID=MMETSP1164-20130828/4380_1 /TAXON_ID=1104430 /ORGANISM="Chrysoreinhardia sp, Strain CCMP2950" /LENGTH=66 /DNA_ID=CAMNT_0028362069 /DNA_START=84 /DNA_END=281 /DNA_ORIENTATION=+
MKVVLALAALFSSASAFMAPMNGAVVAPKTTVMKAFETELGVQPPLGFWDPLGLLSDADQATFDRL